MAGRAVGKEGGSPHAACITLLGCSGRRITLFGVFSLAKFVTFFSPPINRLRPATNFPEPSPFFLLNAPRLKKKSGFQKNFSPDFLAYGRRNITTPKGQGKNSKRYAVDDNITREKHKADMRRR